MNSSKSPKNSKCVWHPTRQAKNLGARCGNKLCEPCLDVPEGYCCRHCASYVAELRRKKSSISLALIITFGYGAVLVILLRDPMIIMLCVAILCTFGVLVVRWLPTPLRRFEDSSPEQDLDEEDTTQAQQHEGPQ